MKRFLLITFSPNDLLLTHISMLNNFEVPDAIVNPDHILIPFNTDLSIKSCTEYLKQAGSNFLLFDITTTETFGMNGTNVMAKFLGHINTDLDEFNEECIFKKIREYGIQSLTKQEREFMDKQFTS